MAGSAPTPWIFGKGEAAQAQNPRSQDQMKAPAAGGAFGPQQRQSAFDPWWDQVPERTSLATTTGQNLTSTKNAFDQDFWNEAGKQDREQKTMTGRWTRENATGIVTYDSKREGVDFGDVFSGGQKVGNVYRGYGGMTTSDSDEIMARLILPKEVWAKAYETEAGRPLTFAGNLKSEIQRARAKRSEDFEKGMSAGEFEAGVSERASQMESSGAWQATNVAAGAAGGTVAGLGIAGALAATGVGAPVGAVVAGVTLLGALGSWLNRDEAFRGAAQAQEQWELATRDGHQAVGYADAAGGFIGQLASKLNVSRNLLHGGYDAAQGKIGDADSAYYNTNTPLAMQGLDFATLLIDGVGSFGSAGARRVYTATMGSATAAGAASVGLGAADGGAAFNPYSGAYEDLSAGGQLQRAAGVGIDAAQTGASGLIGRVLKRDRAVASEGGWVVSTVDGTRQATRVGFSALIPSEAIQGVAARTIARRTMRNEGLANTAENRAVQTARALEDLTTGRKTIAVMAVNGFGEGAEEFVQAALGATAFGEMPTFRELVEASKQGFAMGAGMGFAVGAGSRTQQERYLEKANVIRAVRGQGAYDTEQWSKLTLSEQAQLGTAKTAKEQAIYEKTVSWLTREGGRVAAANIVELPKAVEIARQMVEQQSKNSQDAVEPSRLQVRSNYEWAPQDYVVSLVAAMRDVSARSKLMAATASGAEVKGKDGGVLTVSPEERAQAAQIAEADGVLLQRMQQVAGQVEQAQAAGDTTGATAAIQTFNEMLRTWWHESGDKAYGARRSASVWGARFPLNSAGSFQLLRLQVSPELTLAGNNDTVLIPDEVLPPTGGDFDGDRFVNLLRELLPEQSYQMQRWGAGQLTSSGTMLAEKPYATAAIELLFDSLQRPGTSAYISAVKTKRRLERRLFGRLAQAGIPIIERKKLVAQFVRALDARNPVAISGLFGMLSTRYAPNMREFAQKIDDSPWLAINRLIEDELRIFQTEASLTTEAVSRSGQVAIPEISQAMSAWGTRTTEQTSDMLQGLMAANKSDAFRLQTVLKYNSRREGTTTTSEETADVMAYLIRKFTARNDGLVRVGEDAVFDGTLAQSRVIGWLRQIATEHQAEFGARTVEEAMVLLAGADVSDVDVAQRRPRSEKSVRLIQALLGQVVVRMRSEYAPVLERDEAIASRLNSLERLSRPTFMEGDHTHSQGGDAFVEVFGATLVYDLLGEQSANINSLSVRQLRDKLISLKADVREEYVDALQRHPSYQVQNESPSPYRVLIDNVVESARMQLSEDRVTGIPTGALTVSSSAASENFKTMHHMVRNVSNTRGQHISTPEIAREVLTKDVRLATSVLNLIEAGGVRAGVTMTEVDGVNTVMFPQWIYDVMAESSVKRAEMMLLRHTLINAKANVLVSDDLDVQKVNDRILRMWLDLDFRANEFGPTSVSAKAALDTFLKILTESTSTDQFVGALNTDLRFRDEQSAPYIAWSRDRSLTMESRFGSGVSDIQEGTNMRDALRDAAKVAAAVAHDEDTMQEYLADHAELVSQLKAGRDGTPDAVGHELWQRFKVNFELAKDRPVMSSPSLWINQAAHINEIVHNMGVKGTSPDNVAPIGQATASQLPAYDSAVGQLLWSMTSDSLSGVMTEMTRLAAGARTIVLNDGTVVEWDGMTPERALDLLADPDTAGFASRMLGLTAWDYNADLQRNILVSLSGQGVAGFVADPEKQLFGFDQNSKFRRLALLESMATTRGGPPIIPMILAEQMNIREAALDHIISDQTGEREEIAVSILEDLADALDKLSRIDGIFVPDADGTRLTPKVDEETGKDSTLLHTTLLNAARKAYRIKGVGNLFSQLIPTDPDLRDVAHAELSVWALQYAADAAVDRDDLGVWMAKTFKEQLDSIDDTSSPLDMVLNLYKDYTNPNVQALLVERVLDAGEIVNTAAWARDALLRVQNPKTPQVGVGVLVLPQLTNGQWEDVARAVIAFTMHTTYGIETRSDTQIAKFPSLKNVDELEAQRSFWDPTFIESALNVVVPGLMNNASAPIAPLLEAQLELVRRLGQQVSRNTPDEAEKAFFKLIAPKFESPEGWTSGVTGDWNGLLPALMHSAQGAVLASAADAAIKMAGLNPRRLAFMSATTKQDWTVRPPDSELSTTSIPADQLVSAHGQGVELNSAIDVKVSGWAEPQQKTLAQLEGRVVRQLTINVGGIISPLLNDQRYASGLKLPDQTGVPAGEGGVLSIETFAESVSSWLRDNRVAPDQWSNVTVDVSFFHPDTKSVSSVRQAGSQYDHNPWFDGVGARTDAAFSQQSLIGSFFFGLDGVIPAAYETALASIKKLSFALQQMTLMPEVQRKAFIARGTTDMSGMLDQLTDFAMKQALDGKKMSLTNYNAVRKILSLLYVVRYFDENGPHVLSSEEMVALQMQGVTLPSNAEVIGLPMQHVMALMGEQGAAELTVTPHGDLGFAPNVDRAMQYSRFPSQAWTSEMFAGLVKLELDSEGMPATWATADLLDQPALRNMALPRARVVSFRGPTRNSLKDYFGPYRKRQAEVHAERAARPSAQTKWSEQLATVTRRASSAADANIGARVLQGVQAAVEGRAMDAANLMSPDVPNVNPTNDFTTGWEYVHLGERTKGVVAGILRRGEIEENAVLGDHVFLSAATFIPPSGDFDPNELYAIATEVLRELTATGATLHLPTVRIGSDLRRQMAAWLREHDYVETDHRSEIFVPQPRAVHSQQKAAFYSTLNGPEVRTSQNRVMIELSANTQINENSIYNINGGVGALETYQFREVVQTGRFAGYGPQVSSETNQREHFINTLLPVLQSEAGRSYLRTQSEIDATNTKAVVKFDAALDRLQAKLIASKSNPRIKFLPSVGEMFGEGEIIPLVSYNTRDELVGIHLYRHGHKPVTEKLMFGAAMPEGNVALGAGGARLTIDKGEVDSGHITRYGEVIERSWLGQQGFQLKIKSQLAELGSKVFEAGMKWTTTPLPEAEKDKYPSHAIFAGKPPLGAADLASEQAKTADAWWLNTPSRIIETVGYDTTPHLVRAIYNVDFERDGADAYGTARNDLLDLLSRFKATTVQIEPAQMVAHKNDEFSALMKNQLQRTLDELMETESNELYSSDTAQQIADASIAELVLSALSAGSSVNVALSAPGYVGKPAGTQSHTMHPVFTTLLHQLPNTHPARQAFIEQINARMPWGGINNETGYELQPDLTWTKYVKMPNGNRFIAPVMLSFADLRATDTNAALTEMAQGRRQHADFSETTGAMSYTTWDATSLLKEPLTRGDSVFTPNELLHGDEEGARRFFFNPGLSATPVLTRMDADLRLNRAEAAHIGTRAMPSRRALSVPIDQSAWYENMGKAEAKQKRTEFRLAFNQTLRALKLETSAQDAIYLTEMIRSVQVRPATAEGEAEFLKLPEALAALKLIQRNAAQGNLPTHDSAINTVSRAALERLKQVGYELQRGDGTKRPVESWDDWVDVVLSETFSADPMMRGYPAVSNILDGLMYEYRKDVLGLPVSIKNELQGVFAAVRARSGLVIASPFIRNMVDSPSAQDGDVVFDVEEFDSAPWEFEQLPQDARAMVDARLTKWELSHGLQKKRQSPRQEAIRGAQVREDLARTNVVMRFAQIGIVLKTLVNPGLWTSAFLELGIRGAQERVVSYLAGENLGGQGFTDAQRQQWKDTQAALAKNSTFYGMVYENTNYNPEGRTETRMEEKLQRFTNMATAMFNDPTWGISSGVMARTFMEAAWDSVSKFSNERAVTIEQFLDTLASDPSSLNAISPDAVAHGYSRIEYRRNLQDNLAEKSRRYVVEGIINSGGPGVNTLGTLLLRFPTLFFRFRSNTLINMFGMQGPHAALVALMSDRTRRKGGLYGTDEVSEQARIEDSYDLTRAFIRTGVSHTQLMALGMMLSAAGFGGEDEEEKLLNKLRRYQQPMVAKDPLALENDFRNAEAWFIDLLPAGMGVPTWIIRPFVSPAMGIARFHETGDWRQVLWGFTDALGSMPLLNVDALLNSWTIANELAAAAEAKSRETGVEATAEASRLLMTAVGTLESLLFESSFASMIYQAADEWDRDPYKIPMTNASDEVQYFANGTPRPTEMLDEFVDPDTGEIRQGYKSREDADAQIRGFAENRPVLAYVLSLIKQDSSYIRYNMVPKMREVDAQPLTQEEATEVIVSIFNNETQSEELTSEGAKGVIRGIHLGTVARGDPALQGIFIPTDMRMQIQKELLEEYTEDFLVLGFKKSEALSRAKEKYYGQAFGEPEGTGPADILWDDNAIPSYQTQKYMQLNTTYVMGPNGSPIATGIKRNVLDSVGLNIEGLGPFQTFHDGRTSNMTVDQLLNSVDDGRGMNLGQRGLVKVDESWITPTDEEIGESITKALGEISEQLDDLIDSLDGGQGNGWRNFGSGYRRGGYGGGGGGGYTPRADYGGQVVRLNTPRGFRMPYELDPKLVNTSNPIIRRASVRRERFSADRGRLNQWQ